jgi:hypothetical protein
MYFFGLKENLDVADIKKFEDGVKSLLKLTR